jgi:hypothetical protein
LLNNNNGAQIVPQNDFDMNLLIDQPKIKKTFAIKNPVFLKRNTLTLERDSTNRNLFYIQFNYDAVVDFNLNIYLNCIRNTNGDSKLNTNNNKNNNEITRNLNNLAYLPSDNFLSKIININNCQKGHNIRFSERLAVIDMSYYIQNKLELENSFDVVIEMVPLFSNRSINTNENQILFLTLCKLTLEGDPNIPNPLYRIKTELQRLKSQGMWLDVYDVFNSARESGECLICCSNIRNTLFLPCKHSCCCSNCSHSLRMRNFPCPICKNSINII